MQLLNKIKVNNNNLKVFNQLDQSIEINTETDIIFVNKDETTGMNKLIRLLARKSSNTNDWLADTNE